MVKQHMLQQFVVIERVTYRHRPDFGLKLLAVTDSSERAEQLVQQLRQSYQQNEHNLISFLYLTVDNALLEQRLGMADAAESGI
ncbi:hypothetical protein EKN56_03250 [Limnobaculum zhutongyuii]|uniref:Uncharacterized protein n=1 Tax=Limnobaculum zhutongyuii TaxID=2498113 RepID=A0A411WGX0_9GAMM|nr:hypothetical protein [Limnobaculum zhutongyuii]QBH95508.1 hypothetical protein EKN56_03250 [Limnobaculum zhutongyuii]TQS88803.1 hypothetical protein ELQ32_09345 [Limnobaculum zhutongyuii]